MPYEVCYGEWSGIRCRDLSEYGGATRYLSQEVEQNRGHYCGLPGSDGTALNPSQKVEQSRGRYCGLPGGGGVTRNLLQEVE